jgi:hypothetical protein
LSASERAVPPDGILAGVFAVLVTGPPGSGKTAVLTAMLDALALDRLGHAGVDVDEIAWAFPFPNLPRRCDHLRAWRDSHVQAGATLFVVAEVIESSVHLADVLNALGVDDHLLVRLEAHPATLRQRIIAREPQGWFGLDHLLEETRRLHRTMATLKGVHLVFDSDLTTPTEIAESVRSARSDLLAARPSPPPGPGGW